MSFFDDTEHCRALHPLTQKPVDSYMCMFLDMGRRSYGANVIKVYRKGAELLLKHVPGMIGPNGGSSSINTMAASARDGFSGHILSEYAYVLLDPRACGILRPAIEPIYI